LGVCDFLTSLSFQVLKIFKDLVDFMKEPATWFRVGSLPLYTSFALVGLILHILNASFVALFGGCFNDPSSNNMPH
jgi:hypothetical protein